LPFVTINSPEPDLTPPEFGPMQSVELLTANTSPDCDTIDSGVLLQSPSGLPDRVRIRINSMELRLNGTAYIQAQADGLMTVTVLEGEVALIVDGSRTNVTSGSQASVALNSNLEPSGSAQVSSVSLGDFQALPIRLLPRQVILGESGSSSSTAPEPTQSTGFGTPAPTATLETCMLTAPSDISEPRNLRAGPGIDYPVVINLGANQRTTGIGQINVAGFVWYQTSDNAFVRFDAVELSGSCSGLPIVEAPPSPAASPTPVAPTPGLTSSLLGEVACPDGRVSASGTSDGRDVSISLGGTWTVQAGTTITVTTQGGILRPEFGDYIKLIGEDGAVLANSGEGRQVQATFDQTRTFIARFSAANGDLIVMEVVCSGVTG
jgi:hypothetical protein